MPESRPQRQMIDMEVFETSGVDHPAHGHEGWLVKKSAGAGRLARLENIMRGKTMPQSKEDLLKEVDASKLPAPTKEFVKKSLDLTEDIEAAAELFRSLREKQESQDPNIPTVTEDVVTAPAPVVDAAAAAAPAAVPGADMFGKSLTAAEQVALAKSFEENPVLAKALGALHTQAQQALEKAAREEAQRLDNEAIAKSKEQFKHVAMEHDVVAPALRKLAAENPAAAELIKSVLEKAEGQLEAAEMFKEIGTSRTATGGSAYAKAESMAKAAVDAGAFKTMPEALTQVFSANPELYKQYEAEKEGR